MHLVNNVHAWRVRRVHVVDKVHGGWASRVCAVSAELLPPSDVTALRARAVEALTVPELSHVLLAMGVPEAEARGALRITLGHDTSDADIDALLAALPDAVARARAAASPS